MRKLKTFLALLLSATIVFSSTICSFADSSPNTVIPDDAVFFNGHYYKIFDQSSNWENAKTYCEQLGGYLATITSKEEQGKIEDLLLNGTKEWYWLGAQKINGKFQWITGEQFLYANWGHNGSGVMQPDNASEDKLMIYKNSYNGAWEDLFGTWNDLRSNNLYNNTSDFHAVAQCGFICEWDDGSCVSYSKTYGWSLLNSKESYGYPDGYKIKKDIYEKVYGHGIIPFIYNGLNSIPKWGGSCFGLSLLSLGEYYGYIDLDKYFTKNETYLYDFGYDSILTNKEGKNYFSVGGNKSAIELIEKAFVAQDSFEFKECEFLKNDDNYTELLSLLNGDNARPILVNFSGTNGFAHTVVITNDFTPQKNGDWYIIPLYDSNAPSNSDLLGNNPHDDYKRADSYLLINPKTREWQYYAGSSIRAVGKNGKINTTTYSLLDSIWFYDVAKLGHSFFNKIEKGTLKYLGAQYIVKFSASNILIEDEEKKELFRMNNGLVEYIDPDCSCMPIFGNNNQDSTPVFSFYTDKHSNFSVSSDDAEIFVMNEEYAFITQLNESRIANVDCNSGDFGVSCVKNDERFELYVENIENNNIVKVSGNTIEKTNTNVCINGDSVSVNSSISDACIEVICETIEPDKVNISYDYYNCSHMCHQNGTMGYLWKVVNFICKIFGLNQYCSCGYRHW